jgi:hypothetical protein
MRMRWKSQNKKNEKKKCGREIVYKVGNKWIHHGKNRSQQDSQHKYIVTLRHVCITIVKTEEHCLAVSYFSTISHEQHNFQKRSYFLKYVFDFLYKFCLRHNIISVQNLCVKYPLRSSYFNEIYIFVIDFWKILEYQIS